MCGETVVDGYFAASGLVEDRNLYPVSKTAFTVGNDCAHVLDQGAVANIVAGYVAAYGAYAAIVADAYIMKRGVADAAVSGKPSGESEAAFETAETHLAAENRAEDVVRLEGV